MTATFTTLSGTAVDPRALHRLSLIYLALVDLAALAHTDFVQVTADGIPLLVPQREDGQDVAAANEVIVNLDALLCDIATDAALYNEASAAVPQTLAGALRRRLLTQEQYDEAQRVLSLLIARDIDLEDRTGRERRACARMLGDEFKAKGEKVPSDTALSALAGDHLRYVALREELAGVKQAKAMGEAASSTLARRLDLDDLYVQAHLRRPFVANAAPPAPMSAADEDKPFGV